MTVPSGDLIIVTGMTGAGRSTAAKALEDLGWFVIDNLPPSLLPDVVEMLNAEASSTDSDPTASSSRSSSTSARAASSPTCAVPSPRSPSTARTPGSCSSRRPTRCSYAARRLPGVRTRCRAGRGSSTGSPASARWCVTCAARPTSSSTRRASTCTSSPTRWSRRSPRASCPRCARPWCPSASSTAFPSTPTWCSTCASCPIRTGCPSCATTPGSSPTSATTCWASRAAAEFLERLEALLQTVDAGFLRERKQYLNLAIGCTGGKHRSVAMSEELGKRLMERGIETTVVHRDLGRE